MNYLLAKGWTKEDAKRALKDIDFKSNPDELALRKAASRFAGFELETRQRLQAVQKGLLTKKTNEFEKYKSQKTDNGSLESEIQSILSKNSELASEIKNLLSQNKELTTANEQLKKDNKALKNLVDEIRLKLAINTKQLLRYEDSEIRQALVKLFSWTLG